jgi:flagellar motor switch protein FliN/FliY
MAEEKETGAVNNVGAVEEQAPQEQEPQEQAQEAAGTAEAQAPPEEQSVDTADAQAPPGPELESAADDTTDSEAATVAEAEFQQLSQPTEKPQMKNIELLMDVNLPISIELGRTKMSIADILSLGPGSVVELNKLAGEPVDVLVNNKIVAKGEVVVIDEYFGVRITQLMTPEERLKLLGEEQ